MDRRNQRRRRERIAQEIDTLRATVQQLSQCNHEIEAEVAHLKECLGKLNSLAVVDKVANLLNSGRTK